jgi:protein SPT2
MLCWELPANLCNRYRYAESDYESDSDMEAAGLDILDEEEKSHRKAIREDLEQEKLEKQLAAKKAAMRKKIVTK